MTANIPPKHIPIIPPVPKTGPCGSLVAVGFGVTAIPGVTVNVGVEEVESGTVAVIFCTV